MQLSQRKSAYDLSRKFMNEIKFLSVCAAHTQSMRYVQQGYLLLEQQQVGSSPAFVAFLCPIRQDQVGSELQGISYLTSLLFGVQTGCSSVSFFSLLKISHFLSGQTLYWMVDRKCQRKMEIVLEVSAASAQQSKSRLTWFLITTSRKKGKTCSIYSYTILRKVCAPLHCRLQQFSRISLGTYLVFNLRYGNNREHA